MTLIRKIENLREIIQDGHDFMIKYNDRKYYDRACASAKTTINELGYDTTVLFMDKKVLEFILEKDPELKSQKL